MQLAVMVPYRLYLVDPLCRFDKGGLPNTEPVPPLCDCKGVAGMAFGQVEQFHAGILCYVALRAGNRNLKFPAEPFCQRPAHDAHKYGIPCGHTAPFFQALFCNQTLMELPVAYLA